MTTEDSPEQLLKDMAADPAVRPIIDTHVRDKAQDFLILAIEYARKWTRMEDPWLAESILGEAILWMQEAHKRIDKELSNQMRRDERYKKGGVLIEP